MNQILLLLILTTPVYSKQRSISMSCLAVRETAEVVLEAPELSDRAKAQILASLFEGYSNSCLDTKDAND